MTEHAGYNIEIDPEAERIRLVFTGFWSESDAKRLASDLSTALLRMAAGGARPGHYLGLIDTRGLMILTPEMVARFRAFALGPGTLAQRVAVLTGSTLHTMQMRRIGPAPRYQYFQSELDALVWLEEASGLTV